MDDRYISGGMDGWVGRTVGGMVLPVDNTVSDDDDQSDDTYHVAHAVPEQRPPRQIHNLAMEHRQSLRLTTLNFVVAIYNNNNKIYHWKAN